MARVERLTFKRALSTCMRRAPRRWGLDYSYAAPAAVVPAKQEFFLDEVAHLVAGGWSFRVTDSLNDVVAARIRELTPVGHFFEYEEGVVRKNTNEHQALAAEYALFQQMDASLTDDAMKVALREIAKDQLHVDPTSIIALSREAKAQRDAKNIRRRVIVYAKKLKANRNNRRK